MDKRSLIEKKSLVIDPHRGKEQPKGGVREQIEKMEAVLFQLGDAILQLNNKMAMQAQNNEGLLKLIEVQGKEIDRLAKAGDDD
jgi:gas vesicle protein